MIYINWKLLSLIEGFLRSKWRKVRYIKAGKPLNWISTEDLDSEGNLFPDYKERRKRRKEKRQKEKSNVLAQGDDL